MNDLKELTAENGIEEVIEETTSFENLPKEMQEEFADGKGGDE